MPPCKALSPAPSRGTTAFEPPKPPCSKHAALRDPAPGLYVHVPFCAGKCAYCDFYSLPERTRIPAWIEAVQAEAHLFRGKFPRFDTLYLGGGTPSLLGLRELERLLQGLFRELAFSPSPEITLEANPDDLSPGRLTAYLDVGIRRISLGIQALEDTTLRFLGRRHTAYRAEQALADSLNAGFSSVSVDLIYGIPGQTSRAWEKTLQRVLCFRPHHISCYQLTLSPKTPLGKQHRAGRIHLPEEDTLADLFLATSEILRDRGYLHYEVSNFALPGHTSRHNRKYWRRAPYLGLGPAAHSFLAPVRWWNPSSLDTYIRQISSGRSPAEGSEVLSREQALLETLCLGFRTAEGVAGRVLSACADGNQTVQDLEQQGLVARQGTRVVPTCRGMMIADRLPLLFLP
jgi:oxygen-independent coproporphyrinogen III oxidase